VIPDGKTISVDDAGKISVVSNQNNSSSLIVFSKNYNGNDAIWKANIDGTGQQVINIILPSGYKLSVGDDGGQIKLTNDGQKIIFKCSGATTDALFSCSLDGSNVSKLIDGVTTSFDVR